MQNLVVLHNDTPVVSHRVIAEYTNNSERSIAKIITTYMSDFCDFGQLRFKIATVRNSVGAANEQKTHLLTEEQATLLMTYLRNSGVVRQFKKALVKAFFEMRNKKEAQPVISAPKSKYLSPSVMRELKGIVGKEALDEFYQREVLGLPSVRASSGGCIFRPSERSWDILVGVYESKGMRIPPKDLSQWGLEDKTAFYREFKGHDATMLSILGVWNWLHGFESDPKPIYFDIAAARQKAMAKLELAEDIEFTKMKL